MTTTQMYMSNAFALPTKSIFSLEKSNNTSLSLLSSNADTHYSLGMSYMLLLSDNENENEDDILKTEWIEKSHLHLMACASVYSCMIGRICDFNGYANPDDIGHVTIDGKDIGWTNFQKDGYLKTAFKSSSSLATTTNKNKQDRTPSKVIQIFRERIRNIQPSNDLNKPIVEDMKEMLNEIQETVDSPDDSIRLLLSLSKVKAQFAVENEKRIKREALEGQKNRRRHREKPVTQTSNSNSPKPSKNRIFKSPQSIILPSVNGLSKRQTQSSKASSLQTAAAAIPGKRQRASSIASSISSQDTLGPKKNNSIVTPLKSSSKNEPTITADKTIKSSADKTKSRTVTTNAIFHDKRNENVIPELIKIEESKRNKNKKTKSIKILNESKTNIRKKIKNESVHAHYDSKRHNRYRPMMKKSNSLRLSLDADHDTSGDEINTIIDNKEAIKRASKNLNLWDIGSPIFRDTTTNDDETTENPKEEETNTPDEWAPLPSKSLQHDFDASTITSLKSSDSGEQATSNWKNAPSSVKIKVQPPTAQPKPPPSQKFPFKSKKVKIISGKMTNEPKSNIKKKIANEGVHANYDSKRHNRYRPMMKKTKSQKLLDEKRRKLTTAVEPPTKAVKHAPKGSFNLTFL